MADSKGCVRDAAVVLTSAMTATLYKQQTKAVETENSRALSKMTSVASQAFRCIFSGLFAAASSAHWVLYLNILWP